MPILRPLILALFTLVLALPATAQSNPFATVVRVNDRVVTQYEVNQRILFFQVLRAPGNLEEQAMDRLIEERLQLDAAKAMGISVTDEQVAAGITEFAARANLEAEQFIAAVGQGGVDPETVC